MPPKVGGVWSIFPGQVVPTKVGRELEECSHFSQEASAHRGTAAIWGPDWFTRYIEVKCDNAAVVAVLNSGSSRDPELMHLLRCLSFS